jgi:hypothetical protein
MRLRRFLAKNIPPKIPDFSKKVGDLSGVQWVDSLEEIS